MVHIYHGRIILSMKQFKELLNGKMVTTGHTFDYEITVELDPSIIEKLGE